MEGAILISFVKKITVRTATGAELWPFEDCMGLGMGIHPTTTALILARNTTDKEEGGAGEINM